MRTITPARALRRREEGAALFVAVLMLALMGIIGLASLDTVTADRQITGFRKRTSLALEAAEAGVATAMGTLRRDIGTLQGGGLGALGTYNPAFPATNLGDGVSFPHGQPSFAADPPAGPAISYLGTGTVCDWMISLDENVIWQKTLWDIRVQGQTADGTTSRIQSTAGICRPFNVNY